MAFGYEAELKAEIARLREAIRRLAEHEATLSVCKGGVTVTMDATPEILDQLSQRGGPLMPFDVPPPTLTDAERKAVRAARDAYADDDGDAECEEIAATLRGLLERMGGGE